MDPFVKSIIRDIRGLFCPDAALVEMIVREIEKRGADPNDTLAWRARHDRAALVAEYREQLVGEEMGGGGGGGGDGGGVYFVPVEARNVGRSAADQLRSWQGTGPRGVKHEKFQPMEVGTGVGYRPEIMEPIRDHGPVHAVSWQPGPVPEDRISISTARRREKQALQKTHLRMVDRSDMNEQFGSFSDRSDGIPFSRFDLSDIHRRDYERHMMNRRLP